MDVFELRDRVVHDHGDYVRSFITIRDEDIESRVAAALKRGVLWPDPLLQLNPAFEPGDPIDQLVQEGTLHPECKAIFRRKPAPGVDEGPLRFHRHQVESFRAARAGDDYVLTTGTGSGKSLAYIVPIVDHVLRRGSGQGIQAIVVYPMNALANSQVGELEKYLCHGYPKGQPPVTFRRYTGQESEAERQEILQDPPDILLTNYVMLELVLTRPKESNLVAAARGLQFLVLDELHTYRGRQGADVAMLVRRVREACHAPNLLHVGTSATLAGQGSWSEQQAEVARVASLLFGSTVKPERVIGETLRRVTPERDSSDPTFVRALKARVDGTAPAPSTPAAFIEDPLSSWIESTLGLTAEADSGRLVRSQPRPLTGRDSAGESLATLTGADAVTCADVIRKALLAGHQLRDEHGRPVFAFRLHQFVSKGESVYASPEAEDVRHVTLQAQQWVPGSDRRRALLPLAFCRECGQEYYVVRKLRDPDGTPRFVQRDLGDLQVAEDEHVGFLYLSTKRPWPETRSALLDALPESFLEEGPKGEPVIRKARRDRLPRPVFLSPDGVEGGGDQQAWFVAAPFLFCMHCKVAYDAHQRSDFGKLATLGSEGRSTATTVMGLTAIRALRRDDELPQRARKLLSFTDNRQDASLQAGHFNDFAEVTLLRSALWQAVHQAGEGGIGHAELTQKVFDALALPMEAYAVEPTVRYLQREETQRALRHVLGYYLYRDLRRGWRLTSPNLEQAGLLAIHYPYLTEFCGDEAAWTGLHPTLASASPDTRERLARVLLDHLRRELAIRVDYLDPRFQERIVQGSSQYLSGSWSLDEDERLESWRVALPRSRTPGTRGDGFVFVSARGGFGMFAKRLLQTADTHLKTGDVDEILRDLLEALRTPGLVHRALEPRDDTEVPGYQLNASGLIWRAGQGERAFHDPVRVPSAPDEGLRANPFFVEFYRADNRDLAGVNGHEHTAQVTSELREHREEAFREARLPVLFCSPTMELGVDIAELNVVNMRNVPPTPANYAQRSGRAGRSGQPAFVFTYCAAGSPHDQYFFKRPQLMVDGSVTPPRLDLANEDLLRAHVHAVWLAEADLSLGRSLSDLLDVAGESPSLALVDKVADALADVGSRRRALSRAIESLGPACERLVGRENVDAWIEGVLDRVPMSFEAACERWRGLFRAAHEQAARQFRISSDASRERRDRERAERLRAEAMKQKELLLEPDRDRYSDFNSYRYFASEGFLPGYNFPRLPLSAYLPGRRRSRGQEEFLSRPRFLAISEFGPRAIIYHEGARFVIDKVILPIDGEKGLTSAAAQCEACGYLHPVHDGDGDDLCDRCRAKLPHAHENLFRMQNVATRRRDRINSDEEERLRLGYEIRTGVRFAQRDGRPSASHAELTGADGQPLATLVYGHAATLWRLNVGWRRRKNKHELGYSLDVERGSWARTADDLDGTDDPTTPRHQRVIPFVEDHRNCLLLEPADSLDDATMASLQAALKSALQAHFHLEDSELAAEPLPSMDERRLILLYEAAEGGAGVLREVAERPDILPTVLKKAIELCHFDPETGEDLGHAPHAEEVCESACYDCLLSYYNQRDHRLLDRKAVVPVLKQWAAGSVKASAGPEPRETRLERLMRLCDSELERRWLRTVDALNLNLPTSAQTLIDDCSARPDFLYRGPGVQAAVFVDGPHHDRPDQQGGDRAQQEKLEDGGWLVVRFHHAADWDTVFVRYPSVFGGFPDRPAEKLEEAVPADADAEGTLDLDLFDTSWHGVLRALDAEGLAIDGGRDVGLDGRIVGATVACVARDGAALEMVDVRDGHAAAILEAVEAEGGRALGVQPDDPELVAQILTALGGGK